MILQDNEELSQEPIKQRIAIAKKQIEILSDKGKLFQTALEQWKKYLDILLKGG